MTGLGGTGLPGRLNEGKDTFPALVILGFRTGLFWGCGVGSGSLAVERRQIILGPIRALARRCAASQQRGYPSIACMALATYGFPRAVKWPSQRVRVAKTQVSAARTLYAANGRLIPFNSNSPTGSTFTAFSTFISTRGLMRICPGLASSHNREATLDTVPMAA
jgi:hypothetical protein